MDGDVCRLFKVGRRTADNFSNLSFKTSDSFSESHGLALLAYRLVHEHHHAFLQLIESGHAGSALPLLRPCFESLARAIWLERLPKNSSGTDLINNYKNGRDPNSDPAKLLNAAKIKKRDPEIAMLIKLWELSKRDLHGYTHGNYKLLQARVNEQSMPPLLIARAIRFATQTALQAGSGLAALVGLSIKDFRTIELLFEELGKPDPEMIKIMEL
jgi:hypothetical protein